MKRVKKMMFVLVLIPSTMMAQRVDRKLETLIHQLVQGFRGQVGIHVMNLKTGRTASYNADTIFPTASMVKIPILVGIMDKIQKSELSYHQDFVYTDSLLYAGVDILGSFRNGEKIAMSKLLMLMLTMSDNTASLWLQSLAGTGSRINVYLDSLGFVNTRVNSRTPGREINRTEYGWGQTSPREMVMLMEKIYRGELVSKQASERMLRLLGRNYFDEVASSQIPPYVFVASKNGAVNQSRSETLLVMAPQGPYVFSITTKNNQDERWAPDNEAWMLARKLSKLLWEHYVPTSKWSATANVDGSAVR